MLEWDAGIKIYCIHDSGEKNLLRSLRLEETSAGLLSSLLLTAGPAVK